MAERIFQTPDKTLAGLTPHCLAVTFARMTQQFDRLPERFIPPYEAAKCTQIKKFTINLSLSNLGARLNRKANGARVLADGLSLAARRDCRHGSAAA